MAHCFVALELNSGSPDAEARITAVTPPHGSPRSRELRLVPPFPRAALYIGTPVSPQADREQWEEQALTDYASVAKEQAKLLRKQYDAGLLSAVFPKDAGGTPPEGYDIFHDLIMLDGFSWKP